MKKYYRIEKSGNGAYDFSHDGVIIGYDAQTGKVDIYTDEWCGSGVEGECYRQHVNGKRRPWPQAAQKNIDVSDQIEDRINTYFLHPEYGQGALDLPIEEIIKIIK